MKILAAICSLICCTLPAYCLASEVLVIGGQSLPWNGLVEDKEAGILVEVLKEATRHGAPEFVFKLGTPWLRAQRMVLEPDAPLSLIIPLTRTPERENQYKWLVDLGSDEIRLVSYQRSAPLKSIQEAKDVAIGVVSGHAIIPKLKELGLNNLTTPLNAERNAEMLLRKRFDTLCDARMVYLYNWKKLGQDTRDLQEGPLISTSPHAYIAASPNFPDELAKRISDAIESMRKDGSYQAIHNRWK